MHTGVRTQSSTRRRSAALLALAGTAALGAGLLVAPPAAGAGPAARLTAAGAVARSCFTGPLPRGHGVDTTDATAPATGLVRARLAGAGDSDPGDWDLAVYDRATKRVVAGSAGFRSNELAEGYVTGGQQLVVQACRYAGSSRSVTLSVEFVAAPARAAATGQKVQVVEVTTPKRADKNRLQSLGLDLTEHGTPTTVQVVLHGDDDARRLRSAGFRYQVEIADLEQRVAANRRADQRFAAATARSGLPSGRTSYRRLFDYELEMKQLARRYPSMVLPFVLPERTIEGRDVAGIEIALDAKNTADGKPVFLNMGVHHAREWPAGEHSMEWAYDLLTDYGKQARTTGLVRGSRNIVIPIVNPDGFVVSREALPLGDFSPLDYEMKRKNCNPADSPAASRGGICAANPAGRLRGTDLNRNYAGFWGGPGASATWSSDTFRGGAPFSEPETRNIRDLISRRQITNLITNHTYANLVLRPPSIADTRPPLDEPQLAALGARMAGHNGYSNLPSYGLYDTTGSTEDWSFWNTGGLGYTFEIGGSEFHPAYSTGVVAEYLGVAPAPGAGNGGNREAYYEMLKSTVDTSLHSTLTGTAPKGWILRVHKEFVTPTSPVVEPGGGVGDPILYSDTLDSTYRAAGGRFRWAVNPSTRPYVAGRYGRDPVAPKQADVTFANPAGVPAENTGDPLTGPAERVPFTVAGPPAADNGKFTVHVEWADASTDWDLYVLDSAGRVAAQSAQGGTTREDASLLDPPAGEYTAVLVNYVGGAASDWSGGVVTFASPQPAVHGPKESWTFSCATPDGRIRAMRQVVVDRGRTLDLGNACTRRK
jgi:hypothetical protein